MNSTDTKTVLILEDEPLISMDLELMLNGLGFGEVILMSRCNEALNWLEGKNPKFAILDVRLKDGTCDPVAEILRSRGVPFAVCSGVLDLDRGGSILQNAVSLAKPTLESDLIAALDSLGISLPVRTATLP